MLSRANGAISGELSATLMRRLLQAAARARWFPGEPWIPSVAITLVIPGDASKITRSRSDIRNQNRSFGTNHGTWHFDLCSTFDHLPIFVQSGLPRQRGQAMPYWRLLQKSPPERRPPLRSMRCSTVFCSCGLYHHPTSPSVMRRKNIEKSV